MGKSTQHICAHYLDEESLGEESLLSKINQKQTGHYLEVCYHDIFLITHDVIFILINQT